MKNDLKNILANSNKDIDNQQLMDYLGGNKLSDEKKHEIEMQMAEDAFVNDAIEGLQKINDEKKLAVIVEQLNKDLHKQITNSKIKKNKRLKDQPYMYLAIIIVLLLLILSFIVVKKYLDSNPEKHSQTQTNVSVSASSNFIAVKK
jgi:hypothetical protein